MDAGINNFAFPFSGIVNKLWEATYYFAGVFPRGPVYRQACFESLAPLSLAVQGAYLIVKPCLNDRAWRLDCVSDLYCFSLFLVTVSE